MDTSNSDVAIQFGAASCVNSITVQAYQTLSEALRFILTQNQNQNNNQMITENDARIFDVIEQFNECPRKLFNVLISYFTKLYDIHLYIINFDGTKFDVFNENDFLKNTSKKSFAFLSFNEDNTICGVLCSTDENHSICTVYTYDNLNIWHEVDDYLDELNKSKSQSTVNSNRIVMDQSMIDTVNHLESSVVSHTSISENQSSLDNSIEADDKTEIRALVEQMLQPLSHLFSSLPLDCATVTSIINSSAFNIRNLEHLSPQDIMSILMDQLKFLYDFVGSLQQSVIILQHDETTAPLVSSSDMVSNAPMELNCSVETTPVSTYPSVTSRATDVPYSIPVATISIPSEATPSRVHFDAPNIIIKPASDCRGRTLKDLQDGKNPLLSARGSQRKPIQVPDEIGIQLYLASTVWTVGDEDHISKIAVPRYTTVKDGSCLKNNNLSCLEFDELNSGTVFDPTTRYNYSKISSDEHRAKIKDVQLHIITLYQDNLITKRLIEEKQLNLFKIVFWFCVYQNQKFEKVSAISCTETIREKKQVARHRANKSSGRNVTTNQ